ncbi:hypothetical protein NDU88_003396 [Pleurodeles waltl]|uniref:Uncharacterized protein n=1 Tax=Pleurodeles waltl TaxID=8319 RepID=A0AAV7WRB4_PLEWA|nr:hypothetical protein NDU88_003396 [Pleurodeles waltl]
MAGRDGGRVNAPLRRGLLFLDKISAPEGTPDSSEVAGGTGRACESEAAAQRSMEWTEGGLGACGWIAKRAALTVQERSGALEELERGGREGPTGSVEASGQIRGC